MNREHYDVRRATHISIEELARNQSACFEDYLFDIPANAQSLAERIRIEHIGSTVYRSWMHP